MLKRQKVYSAVDIMYFYEKEIDDIVSDEVCKTKEEAIDLISSIISCGVQISEYGKVMFLVGKVQEEKGYEADKPDSIEKRSDRDIIIDLIKEYFPEMNDYDEEMMKYSEEYTYDNDDRYYIEDVKRRSLTKE